jgi:hypothetical protein
MKEKLLGVIQARFQVPFLHYNNFESRKLHALKVEASRFAKKTCSDFSQKFSPGVRKLNLPALGTGFADIRRNSKNYEPEFFLREEFFAWSPAAVKRFRFVSFRNATRSTQREARITFLSHQQCSTH